MKEVLAKPEKSQKVGLYRGFHVHVEAYVQGCQFVLEGRSGLYNPLNLSYQKGDEFSLHGFIQRLDNFMDKFEGHIANLETEKKQKAEELLTARQSLGLPFPQTAELKTLRRDNREVLAELRLMQGDPNYKSAWRPSSGRGGEKKEAELRTEPGRIAL